jgi:hypothetical protein
MPKPLKTELGDIQSCLSKSVKDVKGLNQVSTKGIPLDELVENHGEVRNLLRLCTELTTALSNTRKKYGGAISNARKDNGKSSKTLVRDDQARRIAELEEKIDNLSRQADPEETIDPSNP